MHFESLTCVYVPGIVCSVRSVCCVMLEAGKSLCCTKPVVGSEKVRNRGGMKTIRLSVVHTQTDIGMCKTL